MKTICGQRRQPPAETVALIRERHLFPKLRKKMETLGSAEATFPGLAKELRGLQVEDVVEDLVLLEAALPAQDLRTLIEKMMTEQKEKGRSCEYYQGSEDSLADLLSSLEEDEEGEGSEEEEEDSEEEEEDSEEEEEDSKEEEEDSEEAEEDSEDEDEDSEEEEEEDSEDEEEVHHLNKKSPGPNGRALEKNPKKEEEDVYVIEESDSDADASGLLRDLSKELIDSGELTDVAFAPSSFLGQALKARDPAFTKSAAKRT